MSAALRKLRSRPSLSTQLFRGSQKLCLIKGPDDEGFRQPEDIDRIEIIAETGGGGAKIYSCYVDGWQCCLKELDLSAAMPTSVVEMEREITALSCVDSPYLCTFLGAQRTDDNLLLLFMSLYDGDLGSLLKRLEENERHLPEEVILRYCAQLLNGLLELHSNLIIHSDLKAANVFTSSVKPNSDDNFSTFDGPVYAAFDVSEASDRSFVLPCCLSIGDFGEAKKLESPESWRASVRGTPVYNPPEMLGDAKGGKLLDDGYSFDADLWSLGQVLTELMTLRPPYDDLEMFEAIGAAAKGIRPNLPDRCLQWYPKVIPIWEKLLTTKDNRASIYQLLDELETLLNPEFVLPTLKEVLLDTNNRDFLEFAESEFQGENVLFYHAVEEFKLVSEAERFSKFTEIYDKFIRPGAKYVVDLIHRDTASISRYLDVDTASQVPPLRRTLDPSLGFSSVPLVGFNVSPSVEPIKERRAECPSGGVPVDVFDSAQETVFKILKIGSFMRYAQHLEELHGVSAAAASPPPSKPARSQSGSGIMRKRVELADQTTRSRRSRSGDSSIRSADSSIQLRKKSFAKNRIINKMKRSTSSDVTGAPRSPSPPHAHSHSRSQSVVMAPKVDLTQFDVSTPLELEEILQDDLRSHLFQEFAASVFAEEGIECWKAIETFKASADCLLLNDLFRVYLLPGGPKQVNIAGAISSPLRELYANRDSIETLRDNASLGDLLAQVQHELVITMKMDIYPKFLERAKLQGRLPAGSRAMQRTSPRPSKPAMSAPNLMGITRAESSPLMTMNKPSRTFSSQPMSARAPASRAAFHLGTHRSSIRVPKRASSFDKISGQRVAVTSTPLEAKPPVEDKKDRAASTPVLLQLAAKGANASSLSFIDSSTGRKRRSLGSEDFSSDEEVPYNNV